MNERLKSSIIVAVGTAVIMIAVGLILFLGFNLPGPLALFLEIWAGVVVAIVLMAWRQGREDSRKIEERLKNE